MRTRLVYGTLFSAALLGSGALAQTAATDNPAPPTEPAQTEMATPDAQPAKGEAGFSFVTTQATDQWRRRSWSESASSAWTTSRSARSRTC